MGAKEINLDVNQSLFEEGDQSNSLYFVKRGVIRIFKRKADGNIEIDLIRAGQLLGELAFIDNRPRSASAEAITTCSVIEINRSALDEALSKLPDWFIALTKTISGRLRTANSKVRALEEITTAYEIDRDGNRSKEYTYINTIELLRFCTALLAVASRYGKNATEEGIEFQEAMLDRFATQLLQVNSGKVIQLIGLFKNVGILKGELFLTDIRFLDRFLLFVNEQHLLDPAERRTLSDAGMSVLTALTQSRNKAKQIDKTKSQVNIAAALTTANIPLIHLQELYDQKFVQMISIVSATEVLVDFEPEKNVFEYRAFRVLHELNKLNEQKRKL